jgi:membrane protein
LLAPRTRSQTSLGALIGVLRAAWREYENDHARYFAGAMVYYALTSLVPLILLLLAVLGLMLRFSDGAVAAEQQVLLMVESSLDVQVRTTIEQLLGQLQQESVVATVVSLVGLLLTSSALFRHLRLSFRAIWKYAPPFVSGPLRVAVRATFLEYLIAYVMVLTGGLLLVLALALIAVTQWLGGLLIRLPLLSRTPAWLIALPSSVIIVGVTFALLFRFLPPRRLRWRHVWLAALLCTAGWIIGAEVLVLFGAFFGDGPTASGAFGGLLVLMLWINVVSQLLFFGAELCKVMSTADEALRSAVPRPPT